MPFFNRTTHHHRYSSHTVQIDAPVLSPPQALALLREGHAVLNLTDGLQLRRCRLMQVNRIELTGFRSTAVDRLKAMGLFSEIISWKLRLFVPDDIVTGSAVLILHVDPASMMCASSRMVVKGKGEPAPRVAACTLLPYHPEFDMGATLAEAARDVRLNHPHCARFCVLGGASCSA